MDWKNSFDAMMEEYARTVAELGKNRKWLDGIFGLGSHPGDAPCHEALDKQVEALCLEVGPSLQEAELKEFLLTVWQAAARWQGPEYARLMLVAIQRHTEGLIPALAPGDRAELAEWYRKTWPRRRRLPIQEKILKALQA